MLTTQSDIWWAVGTILVGCGRDTFWEIFGLVVLAISMFMMFSEHRTLWGRK